MSCLCSVSVVLIPTTTSATIVFYPESIKLKMTLTWKGVLNLERIRQKVYWMIDLSCTLSMKYYLISFTIRRQSIS